jgi:hypothetical protein
VPSCPVTWELAGRTRVELLLDVLNALDDTAEERLVDDNAFSQKLRAPERVRASAARDDRCPSDVSEIASGVRLQ